MHIDWKNFKFSLIILDHSEDILTSEGTAGDTAGERFRQGLDPEIVLGFTPRFKPRKIECQPSQPKN